MTHRQIEASPPADPVVVVTGATRGIGKGIARVFVDSGATVVAVARSQDGLDGLRAELDCDEALICVRGDVVDMTRMAEVAAFVRERFGRVDVVCHNVGIYPEVALEDMERADWDAVIETNLTSTYVVVKSFMPLMCERKQGRFVLISSITGSKVALPRLTHYGASKAGMSGFMRGAALELAPFNVTINAIEPGAIRTEGLDDLAEGTVASMERAIPLGTLGEPEDIGRAALFLGSDDARFITGQTLVIDGGQTLPELPL